MSKRDVFFNDVGPHTFDAALGFLCPAVCHHFGRPRTDVGMLERCDPSKRSVLQQNKDENKDK